MSLPYKNIIAKPTPLAGSMAAACISRKENQIPAQAAAKYSVASFKTFQSLPSICMLKKFMDAGVP